MYEIIENVGSPLRAKFPLQPRTAAYKVMHTGEEKTKTLYQPHSLRKFHLAGGTRRFREPDAKFVIPRGGWTRNTALTALSECD